MNAHKMSTISPLLPAFALTCLFLAGGPAQAQQSPASENSFARGSRTPSDASLGEWRKQCFTTREQKQLCRTMRNAKLKTGQEFFRIDFVAEDGQTATRVEVKVPSGLFLPSGIVLDVEDGTQAKIPFLTCLANLCEASDVVSGAFMDALKTRPAMTVTVVDINLLSVSLKFPVEGFHAKFSGPPDERFDLGLQRQ